MRAGTGIVLGTALCVLALAVASGASPVLTRCEFCHSGPNPGGGYTLYPPSVRLVHPPLIPPGYRANVTLTVSHPGGYEMTQPRATLSVSGQGRLEPGTDPSLALEPLTAAGGELSGRWELESSGESGAIHINLTFVCRLHHSHIDPAMGNSGLWALVRPDVVLVRQTALVPLASELVLREGQNQSLTLSVLSPSRNLSLSPSPPLEPALEMGEVPGGELEPGALLDIRLRARRGAAPVQNGALTLLWENETGAEESALVTIRVVAPRAPTGGAGSPARLAGRATGIASLGLLIASLALGLVRGGGRRRVRVHCAVSWLILALSIYHGTLLALGPYSSMAWTPYLILGWVSAALMAIASVSGLLRRWMTRTLGAKRWHNLHRYATALALVIVVIHALLIGTDLRGAAEALGVRRG
ncbi:MAG: hypothetical protein ACUVV6_06895 [Thermoplasmatota archaeon]